MYIIHYVIYENQENSAIAAQIHFRQLILKESDTLISNISNKINIIVLRGKSDGPY